MEGYTPFQPEAAADDDAETSKESKSKKRRRLGEAVARVEADAKEENETGREHKEKVAEKSKPLVGKWLGEDQPDEKKQEQPDTAETLGDDKITELTPEEEAESELFWTDARLEELYAGVGHDSTEEDAAARQASIEFHEGRRRELTGEKLDEAETEPDADTEMVEAPDQPEAADEPVEIDEDEPISLVTPPPRRPTPPPAGGSTPPAGISPTPPGGGPPPRPRPTTGGFAGLPPAAAVSPAYPNRSAFNPNSYVPDYRTNPNVAYLFVGGLVGYFIGRRRGRIKTEKQMKVVQAKLEKQIEAKQREIIDKEVQVQRLARENYRQRFARPPIEKPVHVTTPAELRPAVNPELTSARRAEKPPSAATERTPERSARPESAGRPERPAKTEFSHDEIMAMSEKIKVGETNLKKIYEAKLVTESGLRRLVTEHLEGNDIRRSLAREFLAKELSYERDPHFREPLSATGIEAVRQGSAESSAAATPANSTADDLPATPAGQLPDAVQTAQPKTSHQVSTGLLAALTVVAILLALFAIIVGLMR
jgi:hypothetical protein